MDTKGAKRIVPVSGFLGVIFSPPWKPDEVLGRLADCFGPLDLQSPVFDFRFTAYYQSEMGPELSRFFCALPGLVSADTLLEVRTKVRNLEDALSVQGRRTVNIDPGYLDAFKVVLLSDKFSGRKVYLGQNCYADVTLTFSSGTWHASERAFPDFRDGRYNPYFLRLRSKYLAEMKEERRG